jgi:hypothetical protein
MRAPLIHIAASARQRRRGDVLLDAASRLDLFKRLREEAALLDHCSVLNTIA